MIDSDGVVITNAQKQYFGEHGLKDDDGNLLVLYRSADGGRTVWDGRSGDSWAKGIYLTDDMYVARAFASDGRKVGDVLEVYARANNPLVIDAQGNNYMSIPMPKDAPEWLEDSADFYGNLNADKLPITAFENGYDAVIIKNVIEGVGGDPATDVILRDANQIKRTDNTNPTDNPDIRYSISDSDYQDAVNRGDTDTAQKMVDEVAKEAGYVVRGYHGTTNLFTVFDTSKSNIENDWGQGIYASTSLDDVEANYASEDGADLTNRIERLAERMQDWEEYEDMDFDQCLEAARKQLSEGEHAVLRVALRMDNPVIVERGGGGTFFGYESEYDEEADDYSEPSGTLIDVVEAMRNIIYDEYEWASYDADKLDDLYSEAIDYGGMSALELQSAVEDILIDVTDEDGNLASKEILRKALERIGYDGIVDKTVAYKFGELSGRRFGGMRGVTEGTTHYIAFDPKQAKLTDPVTYDDNGNVIPLSKRFNKENPDIRYSLNESSSYAEIMEEQQKLYQRDMSLMERKREATNNPERLQAMDDYSNLFSELRGLLPKKRTGTATQAELDRIEEIKVLRDEQMNRIAELNESLGLNAIAEEEQEIRELRESLRVAADEAWAREGAEKENKAIEKSGSTAPEYFRKKALKAFKTTANFNEAGYMLPDGKLLHFSGGERNHRYRDHREIGEIYEATQGTAALNRFLSDGNIRIMAESPGIDLASGVEPTKEQYAALRKFINSHGTKEGQFFVDFSGTEGNRVGKYAYEGRVNADRVLNDIKYFYQNGEVREQSSIGQFLSLSKKGEQVAPIGKYNVFGKDIALESALTPESAPISEEIAPVYDSYEADRINSLSDADAPPVRKKTPPKESKPTEEKTTTRKELHKGIVDDIKSRFKARGLDFDKVLKDAKNLSTFATVDNIPQRVMEKALGYKEGQILSDITVNKVAQNETEGIKWLNSFTDRKNGLLAQISKQYHIKPGSKESAAAQMYAEGFYVDENNDIIEYGDAELAKDFPDAKVQANIKGLANDQRIRQIYDETLAMINESRTRNAYPEIPRLDNYFLHFRAMDDTFSRLGLPFNPNDIRAKDLPTDLNGVTADLKPGQPYFASAMHRTGKRTSFDLLGGLERYLSSAKNQIYHIDDIQTLRALRNYIADTYGQANGLENLDNMSEEEAQERIKEVYGAHLSTFAKFLNEEANVLAGKTALIDRGLEGIIGRRGITFLNELNKQVGSNMVGLNVSSSLTNFIPVAQTFAKGNKTAFVKAFAQTVAHKVSRRSDGFAENSPVMIRRNGADRFYRTPWQKAGDVGYALMGVVDNISTELIARTKYNELVSKGMDSQKAHYETDKWVSRLMGDRSLGQQPQLYNSKMLGLLTKFQLEVRNQLDSQFYDTIQETKVSNEHIQNELARNAKTATKVASTFFQLAVVQHLFGQAFESVAGYNPAFDIVEVLMTAFGFDDEEDSEDTALDNIEQGFLELLEDLPYASTFLDGGRIPISSALPIAELVKGEDEWGNESSRWKTLGEVAPYYALPTGYGQIKKTVKGLSMFSDDHPIAGSYTASGNLRFPVDDTVGSRIKAGIFGQYASENARDYFDNERSALKEKQIQEFIDVDIPIRDYWEYREGLSGLDKLNEKADYIASLDLPVSKKNILINNQTDRKKPIDLTGYEKYGNFEEFDFATSILKSMPSLKRKVFPCLITRTTLRSLHSSIRMIILGHLTIRRNTRFLRLLLTMYLSTSVTQVT